MCSLSECKGTKKMSMAMNFAINNFQKENVPASKTPYCHPKRLRQMAIANFILQKV